MPIIGEFHRQYWRQRANTPPPPGSGRARARNLTPIALASGLHSVVFGPPLDLLKAWWARLRLIWAWGQRCAALGDEERAVLDRAIAAMASEHWSVARKAVRECATTPSFHEPPQWVAYSRAIKGNIGQAQNVFRHLKAVHEIRGLHDGPAAISNPEAHFLAELAYQGMASQGRAALGK